MKQVISHLKEEIARAKTWAELEKLPDNPEHPSPFARLTPEDVDRQANNYINECNEAIGILEQIDNPDIAIEKGTVLEVTVNPTALKFCIGILNSFKKKFLFHSDDVINEKAHIQGLVDSGISTLEGVFDMANRIADRECKEEFKEAEKN